MQRSMLIFENSINSPETKKIYLWVLNKFMKFFKLKNYDSLLSMDKKMLQIMIEDYVMELKRNKKSRSSILIPIASLELFCNINDIIINWKKIKKLVPASTKKTGSKAYTTKHVQKILEFETNLRNKAIIHFIASSGIRIGALPELKIKHVVDIENCKTITIYPDDKEEYITFLTPEASNVLNDYLEKRKKDGEYLDLESPLFRQQYSLGISKPKSISKTGYQAMMDRSLRRCGLRIGYSKQRREIQLDHGFRKRWNTILKTTNGINVILAEKMMGHAIKSIPLDGTYLDPTIEQLFTEFKKAIPELTVNDSTRKEFELDKLNREKSELQRINFMYKKTLDEKEQLESRYRQRGSKEITDKKLKQILVEILKENNQI